MAGAIKELIWLSVAGLQPISHVRCIDYSLSTPACTLDVGIESNVCDGGGV